MAQYTIRFNYQAVAAHLSSEDIDETRDGLAHLVDLVCRSTGCWRSVKNELDGQLSYRLWIDEQYLRRAERAAVKAAMEKPSAFFLRWLQRTFPALTEEALDNVATEDADKSREKQNAWLEAALDAYRETPGISVYKGAILLFSVNAPASHPA